MADSPAETHPGYDAIPYPSRPVRQSHPCHLAALAKLFGLEPVPPSAARVLELGCASGGNLIPIAQDLPGSRCVGIDLSARQIADGREVVERLQLTNLDLLHCSIADFEGDASDAFDYVICHGVYSWVPREIQDKILDIGRRRLSPGGVLYVSYNTLPGWRFRGAVRDMMRYHVASFDDPSEKIAQARSLLSFLIESADARTESYQAILRDEAEILSRQDDAYLFHEHLEDVNDPLYFSEFMERAEAAGLSYLAEADFAMMLTDNFPESTAALLAAAPLPRQEQYMDFLRSRTFRCTLLCHQEREIDRAVTAGRLAALQLALVEPLDLDGCDLNSKETVERDVLGGVIATSSPVTKHALAQLSQAWPGGLTMEQLCEQSLEAVPGKGPLVRKALEGDLLSLLGKGMLRVSLEPPALVNHAGLRPAASPLARDQARRGLPATSRLHASVQPDAVGQWLLPQLDGSRTREDLAKLLQAAVAQGDFEVTSDNQPVRELSEQQSRRIIEHALGQLASNGLLIA